MGLLLVFLLTLTRPLEVEAFPHVGHVPHDLRTLTRVVPNQRNRALILVVEGDQFYQASAREMEGAQAPTLTELHFLIRVPGHYTITAIVKRSEGKDLRASTEACFSGFDMTC